MHNVCIMVIRQQQTGVNDMTEKHTPLPWRVEEVKYMNKERAELEIRANNPHPEYNDYVIGCLYSQSKETKHNAQLITRAVNSHHELIEALEVILFKENERIQEELEKGKTLVDCSIRIIAEEALKKAKGK